MRRLLFLLIIVFAYEVGLTSGIHIKNNKIVQIQVQLEKITLYYHILNMWLEMEQKGRTVIRYLQKKGIKRIAIYGMKELGERLYEELKNTDIEVVCIIDKNPNLVIGDFLVISPEEEIPKVDAIIVTADYYYQEIESQIATRVNCPIYSLDGILGNSFGRYL